MDRSGCQVFISYGRQDAADFANRLAAWLRQEGFEPWLDVENGIPIGTAFDVRIEIGIQGSRVLIAVLSPWAVREQGFCRNELLFAQAHGIPIVPIRIATVEPPIQIISLNYIDASRDPEDAFRVLPVVLKRVASEGRSQYRDWQTLPAGRPIWCDANPLDFQNELALYGRDFVGREWILEQVDRWLAAAGPGVLLLTGEPGIGKSTLAAHLTTRTDVVAIHFCSRSRPRTCNVDEWVAGIVYQLSSQDPQYRAAIESEPIRDWTEPSLIFRTRIKRALMEHVIFTDNPTRERIILILDALDETILEAGHSFVNLIVDISAEFSEWFRLIVTTGVDDSILAALDLPSVRRLHIDSADELNRCDINRYIAARATTAGIAEGQLAKVSSQIEDAANGNFLFAAVSCDALSPLNSSTGSVTDRANSLPRGLGGLYLGMFKNRFPDSEAYVRGVLPILECLAAAREPLPRDVVMRASCLSGRQLRDAIQDLSPFLARRNECISIYHRSVVDWLCDERASISFAVDASDGDRRLADIGLEELRNGDLRTSYFLDHLVPHLMTSQSWDAAVEALTNFAFAQRRLSEDDAGRRGYLRDCILALRSLPRAMRVRLWEVPEAAIGTLSLAVSQIIDCGDLDTARTILAEAETLVMSRGSSKLTSFWHTLQGRVETYQGRFPEAEKHLLTALDVASAAGFDEGRARALLGLGVLLRLGDLQTLDATGRLQSALQTNLGHVDANFRARVWLNLLILHVRKGEIGEVENCLVEARHAVQDGDDPWLPAWLCKYEGFASLLTGNWLSAMQQFETAERCFASLGNHQEARENRILVESVLKDEWERRRLEAGQFQSLSEFIEELNDEFASLKRLTERSGPSLVEWFRSVCEIQSLFSQLDELVLRPSLVDVLRLLDEVRQQLAAFAQNDDSRQQRFSELNSVLNAIEPSLLAAWDSENVVEWNRCVRKIQEVKDLIRDEDEPKLPEIPILMMVAVHEIDRLETNIAGRNDLGKSAQLLRELKDARTLLVELDCSATDAHEQLLRIYWGRVQRIAGMIEQHDRRPPMFCIE